MGRRLRPGDFKNIPLNGDREHQSDRLCDRIGIRTQSRPVAAQPALFAVEP
jgi:hypothetical protein